MQNMTTLGQKKIKEDIALRAVDKFEVCVTLTSDSNVILIIWNICTNRYTMSSDFAIYQPLHKKEEKFTYSYLLSKLKSSNRIIKNEDVNTRYLGS